MWLIARHAVSIARLPVWCKIEHGGTHLRLKQAYRLFCPFSQTKIRNQLLYLPINPHLNIHIRERLEHLEEYTECFHQMVMGKPNKTPMPCSGMRPAGGWVGMFWCPSWVGLPLGSLRVGDLGEWWCQLGSWRPPHPCPITLSHRGWRRLLWVVDWWVVGGQWGTVYPVGIRLFRDWFLMRWGPGCCWDLVAWGCLCLTGTGGSMVVGCWGWNRVGVRVLGGLSLAVKCQVACSGSGQITGLNLGTYLPLRLSSLGLETYCLLAKWARLLAVGVLTLAPVPLSPWGGRLAAPGTCYLGYSRGLQSYAHLSALGLCLVIPTHTCTHVHTQAQV